MSVPYTPGFAAKLLASMDDDRLAEITPAAFQTVPLVQILPSEIGRALIDNERATRRGNRRDQSSFGGGGNVGAPAQARLR